MSDPKGCFYFIFLQKRDILLGRKSGALHEWEEAVFFHETKLYFGDASEEQIRTEGDDPCWYSLHHNAGVLEDPVLIMKYHDDLLDLLLGHNKSVKDVQDYIAELLGLVVATPPPCGLLPYYTWASVY
eukprot:scaffold7416_cov109-Ochromonas_danica.AAC.1